MGKTTDQIAEFHNSGSEDAFSVLVHEFKAQVRALIVGKIGTGLVGNSTASDFVQETFAQAHTTLYEKRVEYLGMDSAWFLSFLAQIAHHKIGNELGRLDTGKRDSSKEERIDNDEKQILDNHTRQSSHIVTAKEDALNYWEEAMREGTVTKGLVNILGLALEMDGAEIKSILDKLFPNETKSLRTIEDWLQKMRIRMRKRFPRADE